MINILKDKERDKHLKLRKSQIEEEAEKEDLMDCCADVFHLGIHHEHEENKLYVALSVGNDKIYLYDANLGKERGKLQSKSNFQN